MIAVLWSYDGWYGFTFLAGEMRAPERSLPWGLIGGTLAITVLYVLMNLVYMRAIPVADDGEHRPHRRGRGLGAVRALGRAASSRRRCWCRRSAACRPTILYAARIYLPMAQDGLFFRSLAVVHPRYLVPVGCLLAQGVCAVAQAFSGTYEQLYTYVVFALFLFHAATGAAVLVLRRTRPDAPRPVPHLGVSLRPPRSSSRPRSRSW